MKRVLLSSWLLTLVLALGLPIMAGAAGKSPAPPPPPSLTKPDNCIQIALPIFGNNTCVQNSQGNGGAIIVYLKDVLKLISGAVGITIIIRIITAGIQYISSFGDPSNIKNAKSRLINAMIALLLFLMMFAILQFLVPGGLL